MYKTKSYAYNRLVFLSMAATVDALVIKVSVIFKVKG